jgi:hypothetical protein
MNFDKKHPVADFDTLYLGPKGGKEREWGKGSHPDHVRITSGISHSGRAIDWYSSKGVLARHRHASNLDNYKKVTWNLKLVTCNLLRRYSIFIIFLQCVLISRSKFCYNGHRLMYSLWARPYLITLNERLQKLGNRWLTVIGKLMA